MSNVKIRNTCRLERKVFRDFVSGLIAWRAAEGIFGIC